MTARDPDTDVDCFACGGTGIARPTVYNDSPRVRPSDPLTSHRAADVAVKRVPTVLAVERALSAAGHPITADEVYRIARNSLGFYCTPQRVRTVLSEENGGPWVRLDECGESEYGNPSHLWALKEAA
ncbi:hypothetical protein J2Y69_003565 [Microbacterium resistens]|uniref:Helix-turn-helix DNA binding domain protein n=1 Tax=Microbacterium resistens TaxID=156977 RepID=A0ABU1SHB4_9MICO|nr:hypothetical protein [Microbacterium resistens]MDR6868939.1 hypothetical protein [Microbacterium resistens]